MYFLYSELSKPWRKSSRADAKLFINCVCPYQELGGSDETYGDRGGGDQNGEGATKLTRDRGGGDQNIESYQELGRG